MYKTLKLIFFVFIIFLYIVVIPDRKLDHNHLIKNKKIKELSFDISKCEFMIAKTMVNKINGNYITDSGKDIKLLYKDKIYDNILDIGDIIIFSYNKPKDFTGLFLNYLVNHSYIHMGFLAKFYVQFEESDLVNKGFYRVLPLVAHAHPSGNDSTVSLFDKNLKNTSKIKYNYLSYLTKYQKDTELVIVRYKKLLKVQKKLLEKFIFDTRNCKYNISKYLKHPINKLKFFLSNLIFKIFRINISSKLFGERNDISFIDILKLQKLKEIKIKEYSKDNQEIDFMRFNEIFFYNKIINNKISNSKFVCSTFVYFMYITIGIDLFPLKRKDIDINSFIQLIDPNDFGDLFIDNRFKYVATFKYL